jgi:hypothetical protein
MAQDDRSFNDLLRDAPLAEAGGTTVVGALSRLPQPDKFMLTLMDGRSITLDTKSVKAHMRLPSVAGCVMVQLTLDPGADPKGELAPFALATPHHVAAETVAALMRTGSGTFGPAFLTGPHHAKIFDKPPPADGTFPGHPTWDV